jgi:uncharacterized membrane protein YhaH (DUF805 family)
MADLVEGLKMTPWLARLSRRSFWAVVLTGAVIVGVTFAVIAWALGEDATASVVGGALVAILLSLSGFILRGELRTFWPREPG